MNPDGSGLDTVDEQPWIRRSRTPRGPRRNEGRVLQFRLTGPDEIVYVMTATEAPSPNLTNTSSQGEQSPDWHPLYQIPQSAPSVNASLVPSYRQTISSAQCAARGGTATSHGAPLSVMSCNPPGSCRALRHALDPGRRHGQSHRRAREPCDPRGRGRPRDRGRPHRRAQRQRNGGRLRPCRARPRHHDVRGFRLPTPQRPGSGGSGHVTDSEIAVPWTARPRPTRTSTRIVQPRLDGRHHRGSRQGGPNRFRRCSGASARCRNERRSAATVTTRNSPRRASIRHEEQGAARSRRHLRSTRVPRGRTGGVSGCERNRVSGLAHDRGALGQSRRQRLEVDRRQQKSDPGRLG